MPATYSVEYAKTGKAKCNGGKDCPFDHKIEKGQLKVIANLESKDGRPMSKGRHWCCVTPVLLKNLKAAEEVTGIDSLEEADKKRVEESIESGELDEESVQLKPPKEKKAKATRKRKSKKDEDEVEAEVEGEANGEGDEDEEEEKPKKKAKKAAPKAKKAAPKKGKGKKKTEDDDEEEPVEEEEEGDDE